MTSGLNRRQALVGAAAGVGVPLLAACGSDSGSTATDANTPSSAATSASGGSGGSGSGSGGKVLAKTADIEVGGAVFLEEPSVVITQPTEGDFHGFNRTCTHQQCPVTDMVDGNIHCACHGSMFSAVDGSPVEGPATSPLAGFALKVKGGKVLAG
ncbi:MAG: Rieske (2Fe-2S) protein [Nocardioides sp.]|uniref:Rieske (2Fe-2S) protein n=1 Tax=Nocardioides sp. TaxID=35761 RepID=UPI0039E30FC4